MFLKVLVLIFGIVGGEIRKIFNLFVNLIQATFKQSMQEASLIVRPSSKWLYRLSKSSAGTWLEPSRNARITSTRTDQRWLECHLMLLPLDFKQSTRAARTQFLDSWSKLFPLSVPWSTWILTSCSTSQLASKAFQSQCPRNALALIWRICSIKSWKLTLNLALKLKLCCLNPRKGNKRRKFLVSQQTRNANCFVEF